MVIFIPTSQHGVRRDSVNSRDFQLLVSQTVTRYSSPSQLGCCQRPSRESGLSSSPGGIKADTSSTWCLLQYQELVIPQIESKTQSVDINAETTDILELSDKKMKVTS